MPTGALYTIVVLIWGTSWLAIKYQLGVVAPEMSIAYRFILASALLIGFCFMTRRQLRLSRQANLLIFGQGLSLFCFNYILFYLATEYMVTGLLSVVFSTITVMNMMNAAVIFRQRIEANVALGAMMGLGGIALVFWPEITTMDWKSGAAYGLALSLIATYLASLGNMASVKLGQLGVPIVESNALGMAVGAIGSLTFALIQGAELTYDLRWSYSVSLLFLSIMATVVGFGCYLTLVRRIGAGRAAYSSVLFPLIALALSTVFEDYHWPREAILGVALVLIGNVLALRRKSIQQSKAAATVAGE